MRGGEHTTKRRISYAYLTVTIFTFGLLSPTPIYQRLFPSVPPACTLTSFIIFLRAILFRHFDLVRRLLEFLVFDVRITSREFKVLWMDPVSARLILPQQQTVNRTVFDDLLSLAIADLVLAFIQLLIAEFELTFGRVLALFKRGLELIECFVDVVFVFDLVHDDVVQFDRLAILLTQPLAPFFPEALMDLFCQISGVRSVTWMPTVVRYTDSDAPFQAEGNRSGDMVRRCDRCELLDRWNYLLFESVAGQSVEQSDVWWDLVEPWWKVRVAQMFHGLVVRAVGL